MLMEGAEEEREFCTRMRGEDRTSGNESFSRRCSG